MKISNMNRIKCGYSYKTDNIKKSKEFTDKQVAEKSKDTVALSPEALQRELWKKMYPVKPGEGNPEYAHPTNGPIKNAEMREKMNSIILKLQRGEALTEEEKAFLSSIGESEESLKGELGGYDFDGISTSNNIKECK